ncbi:MAG: enoyl-CoA hydratase-related protein [bacterium]|jgi:methylglutaconyl-CoA hydratase
MPSRIQIEEDKVTTIWLNRPDVRNAMDEQMITELTTAFHDAGDNQNVRAIILRGRGKSFCAGADLNYMKSIAEFGFDENVKDAQKLAALFQTVYLCPVPTIAMVHGAAFGGANGLLAACDIVIAEENTKFAFSEVKLGIAPATISPFVIRRIGEYGARELMVTGKRFNAREALKWKLVNHVTEESTFEQMMEEIVQHILSAGPVAVRETKQLIRQVDASNPVEELMKHTAQMIARLRGSAEGREGMSSFLEKRKPKWMD